MMKNTASAKNAWNGYYVHNDEALMLLDTWRSAIPSQKSKIQAEFIRRLTYMVQARIKRYRKQPYYDDLLQEGKLGLVKAMIDFDPKRGINFFKFAVWHIQNRIGGFIRWNKRTAGQKSVQDEFVSSCEDTPDPQEQLEAEERRRLVLRSISQLPEIDKAVVNMRYGLDGRCQTLEQVGNRFSVTRQRIQQIEVRAISRIRQDRRIQFLLHGEEGADNE
jgi:RNA polymerase sigma factor (sigma-70 family)